MHKAEEHGKYLGRAASRAGEPQLPLLAPGSALAACALHRGVCESWKGGCCDILSFSPGPTRQRQEKQGVSAGCWGGRRNARGQGTPARPQGTGELSQNSCCQQSH